MCVTLRCDNLIEVVIQWHRGYSIVETYRVYIICTIYIYISLISNFEITSSS